MIQRYRNRISQPILDRIDLYINVDKIRFEELNTDRNNESSATLRARVEHTMEIQKDRYRNTGISYNSQLSAGQIRKYCHLGTDEKDMLKEAFEHMGLSARGYHRILRVSRTIADMEEAEKISCAHIAEALGYRDSLKERLV